jgi:hypothetical protein
MVDFVSCSRVGCISSWKEAARRVGSVLGAPSVAANSLPHAPNVRHQAQRGVRGGGSRRIAVVNIDDLLSWALLQLAVITSTTSEVRASAATSRLIWRSSSRVLSYDGFGLFELMKQELKL